MILTHLAYAKYISEIYQVLRSRGKYVLADVICYWKMKSFMTLDGVTSFLRLKDVTNTCKRMRRSLSIGGSSTVLILHILEFASWYIFIVQLSERYYTYEPWHVISQQCGILT